MKNLGFTLVELLGVIIILGVLLTIITVSVSSVLDNSETTLTEIQIKKVEEAAKNYYISEGMESSDLENEQFKHCVTIKYLIDNGYVDGNEISNFETGENLVGSVSISYESKKYKYEYKEKNCEVCVPVSSTDKTTGNVPKGNFVPGDEYICEVKDNTKYHFFVVSTEEDRVNMIMDRNINSSGEAASNGVYVQWYSSSSNASGPVTAINYLNNATKDWDNILNMKINYNDEGNKYGSVKSEDSTIKIIKKDGTQTLSIVGLKARLPRIDEVASSGLCTTTEGSCPLWLVNYLNNSSSVSGVNLQNISGMYAYWTLSSSSEDSNRAMRVAYQGIIKTGGVIDSSYTGVRPVISVKKAQISSTDRW